MVVVEAENASDNGKEDNHCNIFVTRFFRGDQKQKDPKPFSVRLPSRFCSILQHYNSWFYLNNNGLCAFILPEGRHEPSKDYTKSTSLEGAGTALSC